MKRLAALLFAGALLGGCKEEPKTYFVDPSTGIISNKVLTEKDVIDLDWKPPVRRRKPANPPRRRTVDPQSLKEYNVTRGTFEIEGLQYNGTILEKGNERYGIVKTGVMFAKGIDYYLVHPNKNAPSVAGDHHRWQQKFPKSSVEIKFGEQTFYVSKSRRKVHDFNKKRVVNKLPLVLIEKSTLERYDGDGYPDKNGVDGYGDYYVLVKTK